MNWRLAIVIAALASTAVCAQETTPGWPGLASSRLSTVYVLDDAGIETSGKLLRLSPDSLVLLVDGAERRFETARVARIQKRGDSLRNGAIMGAIVGVGLGVVSAGISDCPGDNPGGGCPGSRAALFLVSTGVYAAIGTGIDALIPGRTTLYEAPQAAPSAGRKRLVPLVSLGGAAIRLNVGW